MRYCARCILPDTRPGLTIGKDGVCSACRSHETKEQPDIDWPGRAKAFDELVAEVKALDRPYDCVVPVSGGKDSTWQVVTCLEHGLKPLAVTWRTPGRTKLGERNLRNLVSIGVDHFDVSINPHLERRFMLEAFRRYGTTAIPMHLAIFNVPTAMAVKWDVPLVVWGENSALEYTGGDNADAGRFELTSEWVRKYGAVHGTTAEDWIGDDLTRKDLAIYLGPGDAALKQKGVRAVFLGMYFNWDPVKVHEVAQRHGFEAADRPLTGLYDFADVDDDFISLHHWMKWHKFGFTRVWDNVSLEIRNGRMTRDEAIETVRRLGDQTPHDDIRMFCRWANISEEEFRAIAETFRNHDVWELRDGRWVIPDFLIDDWDWERARA